MEDNFKYLTTKPLFDQYSPGWIENHLIYITEQSNEYSKFSFQDMAF